MAKVKVGLPQGTRDFSAETVRKRNYIFNTIRQVFELYGYQPLETPAMENLDTLMGKYGEEGDKLIFKILNNGLDRPEKHQKAKEDFEKVLEGKNVDGITERALRYDLTIPFARYVAMNHGQLTFPFKRYQIQPVWRADRPQKGRYREFYQCDADMVGSTSLLNEVEFVNIYAEAFAKLKVGVDIKINNRKILAALAELCGGADKMVDITVAIDKLDKIGIDKVKEELLGRGLYEGQVSIIEKYLSIEGSNEEKLTELSNLIGGIEIGKKGIEELQYVYGFVNRQPAYGNEGRNGLPDLPLTTHRSPLTIHDSPFTIQHSLVFDFTLARGLNYYTGTILEVKAKNVQMGSIGGGGRYDDLTGLFGVPNLPGVGISFGVDRIYDVMEELKLFPEEVQVVTQVLFFNLGEAESRAAHGLLQQLRANGMRSEIYPDAAKFDKQFKYADKKNIPFAVILGTKELEDGNCMVKDLKKGQQQTVSQSELISYILKLADVK